MKKKIVTLLILPLVLTLPSLGAAQAPAAGNANTSAPAPLVNAPFMAAQASVPEPLVEYDFLKEPAGAVAQDQSGNGNDAAVLGAPVWREGRGLYMDGVDDHVQLADIFGVSTEFALTITGEFTPMSAGVSQWQSILWRGVSPGCRVDCESGEFGLWLNQAGYLHFTSSPPDTAGRARFYINSGGNTANSPTRFAAVIDVQSKKMRLHIEGRGVWEADYPGMGIGAAGGMLTIGGVPAVRDKVFFKGYLKRIAVYGAALDEGQISSIWQNEAPAVRQGPLEDPYHPDAALLGGAWSDITTMEDSPNFKRLDRTALKEGFDYQGGLFVHPGSTGPTHAVFVHDGSDLVLSGYAAVIDCVSYCGTKGSARFVIKGDGRVLWESGAVAQHGPAKAFRVGLKGVRELRLISTDGGDGVAEDWAAWLNLKAEKNIPMPEGSTPPEEPGEGGEGGSSLETTGGVISVSVSSDDGDEENGGGVFPSTASTISVKASYSAMREGVFVIIVIRDKDRGREMFEIPVMLEGSEGTREFELRRPLSGWTPGEYGVTVFDEKGNAIARDVFTIVGKKFGGNR